MSDHPRLPTVKRSPANRFSALVAALLLLFAWTGDAVGLHPCPHHSAIPVAGGSSGDVVTSEPGGGHAAHGTLAESVPAAADHGQHDGCTCVGCCPAGVALPVFAAPRCEAAPALQAATAVSADPGTGLPDRFPPFVLPYGHAPPALRA